LSPFWQLFRAIYLNRYVDVNDITLTRRMNRRCICTFLWVFFLFITVLSFSHCWTAASWHIERTNLLNIGLTGDKMVAFRCVINYLQVSVWTYAMLLQEV